MNPKIFCDNAEKLFDNKDGGEVVYPEVISDTEVKRRFKRSNTEFKKSDIDTFYVGLKNWTLKTKFNHNLVVADNYVAHWASSEGRKAPASDQSHSRLDRCLPLEGEIAGIPNSTVVLTICSNQFYGLVAFGNQSFFLQPTKVNGSHVFYETKLPALEEMANKYDKNFEAGFKKFDEENEIGQYFLDKLIRLVFIFFVFDLR